MRARLTRASSASIEVEVSTSGDARTLWYRSPDPVWRRPPDTQDFIAVALAQTAAAAGSDLCVEGPVRSSQLQRLDELLRIWSLWRPDVYRHVELRAEEEVADDADTVAHDRSGAVMGFSGGVDAGFALAAHSTGALGRGSRRIDLGVLVVGWDLGHDDEDGQTRAITSVRHKLGAYGADTAVVATNWQQEFCPDWFLSFNAGLLAVLHTFSATHDAAVHATDQTYRQELGMRPYGSHMMINHLLGNPTFPVLSTGGTHSRLERVEFLAAHPVLLGELRVCYQQDAAGTNCGRCEKCVRTQLEMRTAGIAGDLVARAFPTPMTPGDLEAATVTNATVLRHFEDILQRLDAEDSSDPYRALVRRWVRRERLAEARRRGLPAARVADLEAQVAELRTQIDELRSSRSWRLTQPLRSVPDRLRAQ